jgi:hypothetical protein
MVAMWHCTALLPLKFPRLVRRSFQLSKRRGGYGLGPRNWKQVEAAYRRGDLFDKRRKMMQEWVDYLDKLKNGVEIIPIRQNTWSGAESNLLYKADS